MATEYLTPNLVREMCHHLAVVFFDKIGEPIPPFDTVNRGLLESALALPGVTFAQEDLYPTVVDKGAILFYALIKNHPFDNGNKRIAVTALLVFLYINGYWLRAGEREMYQWAIYVAQSQAPEKDRYLGEVGRWLERKLITKSAAFRVRRRTIVFRLFLQLPGLVAKLLPFRREK